MAYKSALLPASASAPAMRRPRVPGVMPSRAIPKGA